MNIIAVLAYVRSRSKSLSFVCCHGSHVNVITGYGKRTYQVRIIEIFAETQSFGLRELFVQD